MPLRDELGSKSEADAFDRFQGVCWYSTATTSNVTNAAYLTMTLCVFFVTLRRNEGRDDPIAGLAPRMKAYSDIDSVLHEAKHQ